MKDKTKGPATVAELIGRLPGEVAPTPKVVMSDGSVLVGTELSIAGLKCISKSKNRPARKHRAKLLH